MTTEEQKQLDALYDDSHVEFDYGWQYQNNK